MPGGNNSIVVYRAGDLGGADDKLEELSASSSRQVLFVGLSSARCLTRETMSMTSWGSSLSVRVERAIASHSFWSSGMLGMLSYYFPVVGAWTCSLPGLHA